MCCNNFNFLSYLELMIEKRQICFQLCIVLHKFAPYKEPLGAIRKLKGSQMEVELPDKLTSETLSANNPHGTQFCQPLFI